MPSLDARVILLLLLFFVSDLIIFLTSLPLFFFNLFSSYTGSLTLAQKILYKIYDCQFNDFDRLVVDAPLTVKLGGKNKSRLSHFFFFQII